MPRFVDPEAIFVHFKQKRCASLLCGRGNADNSRFAYIGVTPFVMIRHGGNEAVITLDDGEQTVSSDPFFLFRDVLAFYSVAGQPFPASLWGSIGYFSYDAAHCIERLPRTTTNDIGMSIMEMAFYKDFLVFDYEQQQVLLIQADVGEGFSNPRAITDVINHVPVINSSYSVALPKSCCSKEQYVRFVERIINYIKKGDVYEVNLSHRFTASYEGDEYGIFSTLYAINPSPFSAYLNFQDAVIICNSPERFLRAEGRWVETRPIKGTIGRSADPERDRANRLSLLNSEKDDAELSMIVDLLRNDLGKVCEYGSVRVKEHKRIEGFSNVWHLVSIVEGTLRSEEDYGSLLRACFPGGSITGCPKIRSMEIIDELEGYTRNLYTGTIFVANDARLDSNIVIRSIVAKNGTVYFSVGGAVVFDSIPEQEYEETLAKAESIMQAIGRS
jgi:para-aminobenzoate synthetase component 1